jgi:nucleoid-associated protein YgaU
MALSRYRGDLQIRGGKILQTNEGVQRLRQALQAGRLLTQQRVLQEGERLDIIAGQLYGDGRLWWIIAATSGIGWPLQVPPGTLLTIPLSLEQVARLV